MDGISHSSYNNDKDFTVISSVTAMKIINTPAISGEHLQ